MNNIDFKAGEKSDIHPSGNWVILDIGFSGYQKSCGLFTSGKKIEELKFNEAVKKICNFIKEKSSVNLLIEAPLSVAFDKNGNPKGRKIDKDNGSHRYWYEPSGCIVMVATMYLIQKIKEIKTLDKKEIKLFEGFVSFKSGKTDHIKDVKILAEVVKNSEKYSKYIFEKNQLKMSESDKIKSTFSIMGIDAGIPPVIKINDETIKKCQ